MKLVTVREMQALERDAEAAGIPVDTLMEQAGLAVAQVAARELRRPATESRVVVLVGPGNNGGDGLVAVRHLGAWGINTLAYLCVAGKALQSKLDRATKAVVRAVDVGDDDDLEGLKEALRSADLVIDAVLGTGQARRIEEPLVSVLKAAGEARQYRPELRVLALDIPTGLDADTGAMDEAALAADLTVTLGHPKRGLLLFPGASAVGRLEVADIGLLEGIGRELLWDLITPSSVAATLPQRPLDSHKGTFGRALVVAGSRNYIGASSLACNAAMRGGAGLVTLATPESVYRLVASQLTEATFLPLPEGENGTIATEAACQVQEQAPGYESLLVGCGLGQSANVTEFLAQALLSAQAPQIPIVLDADALNGLAKIPQWWERLKGTAVLTPHPGEIARLTGRATSDVQANRLEAALDASRLWRQVVVLKGAYTVVATPDGRGAVSPFANPALASAGTGDVLAGLIAGLLAQGLSPFEAAVCSVYVHAMAGARVSQRVGGAGLLAGDLLPEIPQAMKLLKESDWPATAIYPEQRHIEA